MGEQNPTAQSLQPKAVLLGAVLFLVYAPYGWILFLPYGRGDWLLPALMWPGLTLIGFVRELGGFAIIPESGWMLLAVPISLLFPMTAFALMARLPNRRVLVGLLTVTLSSVLSLTTYLVSKA